jgi:hypothetical protein
MLLFYWILIFGIFLNACGEIQELNENPASEVMIETQNHPLQAYCEAEVIGVGTLDAENVYLPSVVNCENGGAPLEALKAQAVAARTYLYYNMETSDGIEDGQSDQVYSCNRNPGDIHFQAVRETVGEVLTYRNKVIAAFYVAGSIPNNTQTCVADPNDPNAASTEQYVTYNEGKSGTEIEQTILGWVNPEFSRNRGCQSQNGARCLANLGWQYQDILRFYYGEDIVFTTATGTCVQGNQPQVLDMSVSPMIMDQGIDLDQGSNQNGNNQNGNNQNGNDQNINPMPSNQDQGTNNGNQDQNLSSTNNQSQSICQIEGPSASLRAQAPCVHLGCVNNDRWEMDQESNFRANTRISNSCEGTWRFQINLTGIYELRLWGPSWVSSGSQVRYILSGGVYASSLESYLWPQSWNLIGKFSFNAGDVIELTVLNQSNQMNGQVPFSSLMIREEGFIRDQEANGIDISAYDSQGNVNTSQATAQTPVVGCDQQSQSQDLSLVLIFILISIATSIFRFKLFRFKLFRF